MKFPEFVQGPLIIEDVRFQKGKHVYIVGESHSLETHCTSKSTHFLDVVKDYAIRNSNKKIAIIYEECFEGMVTKTKHTPHMQSESMLDKLSTYIAQSRFPRNVTVTFGDARFMAPFDNITALYEHETVLFNRYRRNLRKAWTTFKYDFMKQCKALEKRVITHTKTRRKLVKFIRSLLLPGVPYPSWFNVETQENPIKEMLASLPAKEYNSMEFHIIKHLTYMVDENKVYSPLMDVIASRRNTASTNLEYEKNTGLHKFFVMLFSIVQDTYMLCHYLIEGHKYDDYIFIVGAVHGQSISQYINGMSSKKYSRIHRSDARGCVDMYKASLHGPISEPMFGLENNISPNLF